MTMYNYTAKYTMMIIYIQLLTYLYCYFILLPILISSLFGSLLIQYSITFLL